MLRCSPPRLRLHQGEPHRLRCLQPLPPIVEGLLAEPLFLAEPFYRYTASLLRRDPRAPILVPCTQFPCHSKSCHGSHYAAWRPALEEGFIGRLPISCYVRVRELLKEASK